MSAKGKICWRGMKTPCMKKKKKKYEKKKKRRRREEGGKKIRGRTGKRRKEERSTWSIPRSVFSTAGILQT